MSKLGNYIKNLMTNYKNSKAVTISEKQTEAAELASVHTEFANHPSNGLTPPKIGRIFKQAEQGDITAQCDLFEDMEEKDGHIYTEMAKRKRALLTLDWSIEAPVNASAKEQKWADEISEYLTEFYDFEDMIMDMADAVGKGFSCLELDWQDIGKNKLPISAEFIKQRNFKVKANDVRLRDRTVYGQELWDFGWITHVHKARSGYLDRAALFRTLVWPYLFKNYSVRDLAEFLEIYGLPLRLGTYPAGASANEKLTLKRAVSMIGHYASGIVPEGMMIEFKEAAKGTEAPFKYMVEWCERTQSKCIVGQTLTAQADGKTSTNALGSVHMEVMRDLICSDAKQLQSTITRDLILPMAIININGVDPRRAPRFAFDTREYEDMKVFGEALQTLVDMGMDVPEEWARDKMGVPEAQKNEKVLTRSQPTAAASRQHIAECAHDHTDDGIDEFVKQLDDEAASAIGDFIKPIQKLIATAKSMDEVRDGLINLYPDYDATQLGLMMQKAFAAAELAGRYEVTENK